MNKHKIDTVLPSGYLSFAFDTVTEQKEVITCTGGCGIGGTCTSTETCTCSGGYSKASDGRCYILYDECGVCGGDGTTCDVTDYLREYADLEGKTFCNLDILSTTTDVDPSFSVIVLSSKVDYTSTVFNFPCTDAGAASRIEAQRITTTTTVANHDGSFYSFYVSDISLSDMFVRTSFHC